MYKHINKLLPNHTSIKSIIITRLINKTFTEANKPTTVDLDNKYKSMIEGLNKDWKKVALEKEEYRMKMIKEELLPSQQRFIELLASKINNMNRYQIEKVIKGYKAKSEIPQVAPLTISEGWLELQNEFNNEMPKEGTRFSKQEEIMKSLTKWYQTSTPGFAFGASQAAPAKIEKVEEKKEEKVVQKEMYDIELISFDPAKKVLLIKEVRGLTNLGLKEAKELVEKAPTVIMKGIKRAECEVLMKKIGELGGVARLKG